jgi:uncharacterized membrane protein (DUF4010 family)
MTLAVLEVDQTFLLQVALALALSFMVGLQFHSSRRGEAPGSEFGTTRTLTLIGLVGFLTRAIDSSGILFALSLAALSAWLSLYYQSRLRQHDASLMAPLVALLVYLLGFLAVAAPPWFVAAYAVTIVFFLSAKPRIQAFADTLPSREIATAAKFLIMAGVVLPLLPDRQIAVFIPVTFRDVWFAAVAVSGISYLSYLAGTYVFKRHNLLLTGLLGGLYSSTATTIVVARHARRQPGRQVSPALMFATAMMYVRLLALAALLAPASLARLAPPMLVAAASTLLAAFMLARFRRPAAGDGVVEVSRNPLEFQVALLFAGLYIVFGTSGAYVTAHYGELQLEAAAFLVGFTEIDPFVLSILSSHGGISLHAAVDAAMLATAGNNLLKAGLAPAIARDRCVLPASLWLTALAAASLAYVVAG